MMKKSYIFFVLILSNLFGQSYSGIVKDISGEPISYVIKIFIFVGMSFEIKYPWYKSALDWFSDKGL